jgi:hypothetical protein
MTDNLKLAKLAEIEGKEVDTLLEDSILESVVPGICCNPDEECDYSCEVEPDQDKGWCENCRKNTVKSVLILVGLI